MGTRICSSREVSVGSCFGRAIRNSVESIARAQHRSRFDMGNKRLASVYALIRRTREVHVLTDEWSDALFMGMAFAKDEIQGEWLRAGFGGNNSSSALSIAL